MSSNEQTTSSVMLLLKQRASNVDQLLKKQKKLEKSAKEMKLEIQRLNEENLIKEQTIQKIRETQTQVSTKNNEYEELITEKSTLQATVKEQEKRIFEKETMIIFQTNKLLEKDKDLNDKAKIIDAKNVELMEKANLLQLRNRELMEKEKLIQEHNETQIDLEKLLLELRSKLANKRYEELQNHHLVVCNKCGTNYKNNKDDFLGMLDSTNQKDDSTKSIFDIDGIISSDDNDLDHANDRYGTSKSHIKTAIYQEDIVPLERTKQISSVKTSQHVEKNKTIDHLNNENKQIVENHTLIMSITPSSVKENVTTNTKVSSKDEYVFPKRVITLEQLKHF